jgi:hypothetical protein
MSALKADHQEEIFFISDRLLQEEFNSFINSMTTNRSLIIISNVIFFLLSFYSCYRTLFLIKNNHYYIWFYTAAIFVALSWVISLIINSINKFTKFKNDSNSYTTIATSASIFMLIFAVELTIIGRVLNGDCKNNAYQFEWQCDKLSLVRLIPLEESFILMFSPIYIYSIFHSKFEFTLLIWLSVCLSLITCIIISSSTSSIFVCALYIPINMLILLEIRRSHLQSFFYIEKSKSFVLESKHIDDANNATELRHMIGNVAHDLKTVMLLQ